MIHGFDDCRGPLSMAAGARRAAAPVWLAGALVFVLLIGAGIGYRAIASRLRSIRDNPVTLPVPLSAIPIRIDSWVGQEKPLETTTDAYMRSTFADDYVSRQYTNTKNRIWADVYVVYCSSYPGGLLGHKPDVCFPAHGWICDHTSPTQVTTRSGQTINCLSHQFHKPAPSYGQVFVLSFYVLNGQITLRERDFSGVFDRTPNISGNPARYVAQVQISSVYEPSARSAACDLVDVILTYLPDRHGFVKATSSFAQSDTGQEAGTKQ
ncbi:MAG: exosortase-associated EpsI family protein [Sedimentisphaerales bacterium]|nr:exosortase-associated EpsI family protein [Sedimentisphaerales bacterium]